MHDFVYNGQPARVVFGAGALKHERGGSVREAAAICERGGQSVARFADQQQHAARGPAAGVRHQHGQAV